MSVRTEAEPIRVPYYRVAAVVAWLVGCFFTALFVAELASIDVWSAFVFAAPLQLLLTFGQRQLWIALLHKRGTVSLVSIVATLIDGIFNAGGLYPTFKNLPKTSVGTMLMEAFNLSSEFSALPAAILAIVIGVFAAGLAEYLWQVEDE